MKNITVFFFAALGLCVSLSAQQLMLFSNAALAGVSGPLVMGSAGNVVGGYTFVNTTAGTIRVSSMNVLEYDILPAGSQPPQGSSVSNLTLWQGASPVGQSAGFVPSVIPGGSIHQFFFRSPIVVPRMAMVAVLLKGDIPSFASGAVTDGVSAMFEVIVTSDAINQTTAQVVQALDQNNNPVSVQLNDAGKEPLQRILRSDMTASAAPLGATSGRGKTSVDQLGQLTLTANSAGGVGLKAIAVTFGGTAPNSSFLGGARLLDSNGVDVTSEGAQAVSSACSGMVPVCEKTWYFPAVFAISPGSSESLTLVVDDSLANVASGGSQVTLSAAIAADDNVLYTDSLAAGGGVLAGLPRSLAVPLLINSITFMPGT